MATKLIFLRNNFEKNYAMPPAFLEKSPVSLWTKNEIIKYAEYIKYNVITWKTFIGTDRNDEIFFVLTPRPSLTIKIYDFATGKLLYPNPKKKKQETKSSNILFQKI